MKELLLQLLERLEQVGDDHEELFDADVREKMRDAVTEGFFAPVFELPDDFAMYSSHLIQRDSRHGKRGQT
jgi:hypothetical protein